MDDQLTNGDSAKRPSARWRLRALIALLLVMAYGFSYFIVPKIEAAWKSPGPAGCELRLIASAQNASVIPTAGYGLIIVAAVNDMLHFRIFDDHGTMVVDTDEKKLAPQTPRIQNLKKRLAGLWPPQKPTHSERVRINAAVTSIVGYTWLRPPRWVHLLASCSHFAYKYTPTILVVLTAVFLRRRFLSVKGTKRRRLQFGLMASITIIAAFAVILAMSSARWLAPYRAEQRAKAALTRVGGKVVMVDRAPRWLRYFVSKSVLNMDGASVADLRRSRVADADLIHLSAFRYCLQINLSDTQITNAGLTHLRRMGNAGWIDLSHTRVTDVSALFSGGVVWISSLKLSGNRIRRLEMPQTRWSPLIEVDLSDTDADDGTLSRLPDGLVNLSDLDLSGTNVTDDGLLSLLRMEGLTKLNVMDTEVTAAGVARLKSLWRFSRPLTVLTGKRKKAGGAPKSPQTGP